MTQEHETTVKAMLHSAKVLIDFNVEMLSLQLETIAFWSLLIIANVYLAADKNFWGLTFFVLAVGYRLLRHISRKKEKSK